MVSLSVLSLRPHLLQVLYVLWEVTMTTLQVSPRRRLVRSVASNTTCCFLMNCLALLIDEVNLRRRNLQDRSNGVSKIKWSALLCVTFIFSSLPFVSVAAAPDGKNEHDEKNQIILCGKNCIIYFFSQRSNSELTF